jgi:diguanylate cyclase (GGDEF)-like protein
MRSPAPRADLAMLPEVAPPAVEALAEALAVAGFEIARAPAEQLPFEAYFNGATVVVLVPDAAQTVAETWLTMCERAPVQMPVSAVWLADGVGDCERWLAAGFDEVLCAQSVPSVVAARLAGRVRSREVHHCLATLDPLTGLVTHRVFLARLDPTVRLASRASLPMAVAVVDMDGFRDLERRRGRAVVRMLLSDVSRQLERVLRRSDTVARLGDDRFGLILHHITAFEARKLLYKLWRSMTPGPEGLELAGPQDGKLTFTAGVAVFPGDSSDGTELYTRAEIALDVARATGQRRVLLYSETSGDAGQTTGSTDLRLHRVGNGRRDKPE